jgi:transcriptional regulator with XRE-family HTH domain
VRIRTARLQRGWTQKELAGDRYTGSYISALENGLTRPSIAALQYLADRLGIPADAFIRDERPAWDRLHADLLLASEQWQEAADTYSNLLDGHLSETERALALRGRAEAYCRLQRGRDALADASAAYPILVAAGLRVDAAYAAYWLAYAHYQLENTNEARALIQQVLAEVRAGLSVQSDFRLRLLVALANIEGLDGRHQQALAYLEEGRALAEDLDDRRRATYYFSLALGYSEAGDHEGALHAGRQALALYESAAADNEVASLMNTLAITHLQLGNLGRARTYAKDARRSAEQLGDDRLRSHVLDTEARIAASEGNVDQAIKDATESARLAEEAGYAWGRADALHTRARAHQASGNLADAEADYSQAAAILRQDGPHSRLRAVLRDWSELLVTQQRHAEAVVVLTEALSEPPSA